MAGAIEQLEQTIHDPKDPNPWLALYLDTSVAMNQKAKASFLVDVSSRSRQFLFPLIRPFTRLFICLFQVLKIFVPNRLTSPWLLHRLIYVGLKYFVSPQANLLIVRHMHVGSELLGFIARNTKGVDVPLNPLKPKTLADLKENVFLQHDLNIYNFIINLNRQLKENGIEFQAKDELDYCPVTDGEFDIEDMPNGWFNVLDLESAIELYTPLYQLFLTDSDFWRACNSLQLDETVALYATRLVGDMRFIGLVNNRHPIVPENILGAAHRLMLHGLAAECLHAFLVQRKRQQQKTQDADE